MTKGDETRARILDTALELFWKKSFHAVNTARICEVARVNKATLYRYFPSKSALATSVIEHGRDRTLSFVFEGAFAASPDARKRLRGIFERVHATHRGVCDADEPCPGCPFVNLGVELGTQNPEVLDAVNGAFARFRPYYRRIVADATQTPIDVDRTADALQQLMNAGMVAAKLNNDPEEILRAGAIAERLLDH